MSISRCHTYQTPCALLTAVRPWLQTQPKVTCTFNVVLSELWCLVSYITALCVSPLATRQRGKRGNPLRKHTQAWRCAPVFYVPRSRPCVGAQHPDANRVSVELGAALVCDALQLCPHVVHLPQAADVLHCLLQVGVDLPLQVWLVDGLTGEAQRASEHECLCVHGHAH